MIIKFTNFIILVGLSDNYLFYFVNVIENRYEKH